MICFLDNFLRKYSPDSLYKKNSAFTQNRHLEFHDFDIFLIHSDFLGSIIPIMFFILTFAVRTFTRFACPAII